MLSFGKAGVALMSAPGGAGLQMTGRSNGGWQSSRDNESGGQNRSSYADSELESPGHASVGWADGLGGGSSSMEGGGGGEDSTNHLRIRTTQGSSIGIGGSSAGGDVIGDEDDRGSAAGNSVGFHVETPVGGDDESAAGGRSGSSSPYRHGDRDGPDGGPHRSNSTSPSGSQVPTPYAPPKTPIGSLMDVAGRRRRGQSRGGQSRGASRGQSRGGQSD